MREASDEIVAVDADGYRGFTRIDRAGTGAGARRAGFSSQQSACPGLAIMPSDQIG
jgi:hypothetical protein